MPWSTELVLAAAILLMAAVGSLWLRSQSRKFDRTYDTPKEPRL